MKQKIKRAAALVLVALLASLSGCAKAETGSGSSVSGETSQSASSSSETAGEVSAQSAAPAAGEASSPVEIVNSSYFDEADLNTSAENAEEIKLNGSAIAYNGSAAKADGSVVTVTVGGTFRISGALNDEQIIVDCEGEVHLILDSASIASSSSSPLKILNSAKTVITLVGENTLKDASAYGESDEATACLFSKQDLTLNGTGTLQLSANYNDGITCKDTLKIVSGTLEITAADDGVIGRDLIVVNDGNITVNAGGDGIKATNDADENSGNIIINGGTFDITAGNDGIQAVSGLSISGGEIGIVTAGGSAAAPVKNDGGMWGGTSAAEDESSAKGLKAAADIEISGGSITVDSYDDAVHSNDSVTISNGTLLLSTGDDGVHADAKLYIGGGEVTVTKSYEGLESAEIIIDGGTVSAAASDDGINAAGGNDSSGTGGPMGGDRFSSSTGTLTVGGGTVYVNADGDGLDANGNITMTGGAVTVDGPENGGNGALDYDGTFELSGGTLIAAGSAQMAQAPSDSSPQYSILVGTNQGAGTEICLLNAAGETVLSYTPQKQVGCVLFSSPELVSGETYSVTADGETVGACTVASAVNTIGNISMGMGGMGDMGGRGPGGF